MQCCRIEVEGQAYLTSRSRGTDRDVTTVGREGIWQETAGSLGSQNVAILAREIIYRDSAHLEEKKVQGRSGRLEVAELALGGEVNKVRD